MRQRVLHTPAVAVRDAEPFTTADLLEQLGDTDLLELTDVDGQLYAVVVTGGRLRMEHVGPTEEADRSLAHALFALRREGSRRGAYRLDLAEIGLRLERNLLGGSVRLLRGGPLVVVPTGRLHAVPWGLMPSLRERATSVAPSASAWLRARRAARPAKSRVVLVAPEQRRATRRSGVWPRSIRTRRASPMAGGGGTGDGRHGWRVAGACGGARHVPRRQPLFSAIELDDGPLMYDLERLKRAPYRVLLSSCSSAIGAAVGADELLGLVSALISWLRRGGGQRRPSSTTPPLSPSVALHDHLRAGTGLPRPCIARYAVSADSVAYSTAHSFIAPRDVKPSAHCRGSKAYPVREQPPRRCRTAGGPAARHAWEVEEAGVVGLDMEYDPVGSFHPDLPRSRRDDLADDSVGQHLQLQRQRRRREHQNTRIVGIGPPLLHALQ